MEGLCVAGVIERVLVPSIATTSSVPETREVMKRSLGTDNATRILVSAPTFSISPPVQ